MRNAVNEAAERYGLDTLAEYGGYASGSSICRMRTGEHSMREVMRFQQMSIRLCEEKNDPVLARTMFGPSFTPVPTVTASPDGNINDDFAEVADALVDVRRRFEDRDASDWHLLEAWDAAYRELMEMRAEIDARILRRQPQMFAFAA